MKNPILIYTLARLGVFSVLLTIMLLAGFPPLWAALFSAMLSLAFSLIFLRRSREASSAKLYDSVHKPKKTADEKAEDE